MNGKELFNLLYDEKIKDDECIEVIHPDEKDHFIMRHPWTNKFDLKELMSCLLFKEYTFKIIKQSEAEERDEW